MELSSKQKRPDKQIYRPPSDRIPQDIIQQSKNTPATKGLPVDDYNRSSGGISTNEPRISSGELRKNYSRGSRRRHHITGPANIGEGVRGSDHSECLRATDGGAGLNCTHDNKNNAPQINAHNRSQPASRSQITADYVQAGQQTPTTIPAPQTANSRQGGIIRLPKDVNLAQLSEPITESISYGHRGRQNQKPVLIVHPHQNPTITRDTYFQPSSTLTVQCDTITDNRFQQTNPNKTSVVGMFGNMQLNRPAQPPELPLDFAGGISTHLSSRPLNPAVAEVVFQIVQMDAAFNTLMIPPVQCAYHMPPLPDEQSKEKSQLSEPERLFLRWWSTLDKLRMSLMVAYERVILEDLEFCNTAHVEQGMWKSVFYTVLESLRVWIANPYMTGLLPKPNGSEEGHKVAAEACSRLINIIRRVCIEDVIKMGERRLSALLHRIQAVRRVRLDYVLADQRPPPETGSRTRRLVYICAQKLMLFLGDLARYEEMIGGGQNFGKARNWYQKAQLLIPKNGRPYNQLAILAIYTSRHFDAMCYYMRTLAATIPFATASQSLSALFYDVHIRGLELLRDKRGLGELGSQIADNGSHHHQRQNQPLSSHVSSLFGQSRPKRVEIWIHPVNGTATIVQGNRSLTVPHVAKATGARSSAHKSFAVVEDEEEEAAQAEAEEYANMSLIELTKLFGIHFMHVHGQLFTKIGMETFPEVASLALQALSGLLAQCPCPLSADRLCQILMVNMFNVDRAAISTVQSTANMAVASAEATKHHQQLRSSGRKHKGGGGQLSAASSSEAAVPQENKLQDSETLRSVHHDNAARFALDTFSLMCRRAAKLFTEVQPNSDTTNPPPKALPPDLRALLPALRLFTEWMILHPEHWSPPPNHRDPTLRPHLDDWRLVAELCSRASEWMNGGEAAAGARAPTVEEITPTTALVVQLQSRKLDNGEGDIEDDSLEDSTNREALPSSVKFATLFEETVFAGFKPMLDLTPKMYKYSGDWDPESVADFIRIEKIALFGDFLCGIEPPILSYDTKRCVYETVVARETCERREHQQHRRPHIIGNSQDAESTEEPTLQPDASKSSEETNNTAAAAVEDTGEAEDDGVSGEAGGSDEIGALRRQRAALESQLSETRRLEAWRALAVREAAAGGPRGIEIEVRPVYILPDTNCYIDWLDGIARLAQPSSNYTQLVDSPLLRLLRVLSRVLFEGDPVLPLRTRDGAGRPRAPGSTRTRDVRMAVLNELDFLASQDRIIPANSIESAFAQYLTNPSWNSGGDGATTSRASLIQERARAAISFLEEEFDHRNPRLRALTASGSMLETIAYRNEANRGKQPGQINDDVIITCCRQFCKEGLAQMSAEGQLAPSAASKNQPMRVIREVVLLTSDRNLRLKALTLNIPARPLRPFVEWSCLRPVSIPTNRSTITTSEHLHTSPKLHTNTKSSAGGSGRWLNRK